MMDGRFTTGDHDFSGDALENGCGTGGDEQRRFRRRRTGSALLTAVGVTVAAAALSLGGVAPAHAGTCTPGVPYPPAQCTALVSATTLAAGGVVTLSASGFAPNSQVTIQLLSSPVTLAVVTADPSGNVKAKVQIPGGTIPGTHTITLTGVNPDGSVRVLSVTITVTGGSPTGEGQTAHTGLSGMTQIEVLGGVLLGAGALTLVLVRRRRRTDAE